MKILPIVACASLVGCGGIRIGTDDSVGAGVEAGFLAVYRVADFVRFPGDRDSIVASQFVGGAVDLVVPASSSPLRLSFWSQDSAFGAWVRDPMPAVLATRTSFVVSIELTDSVLHRPFELSMAGIGYGSSGIRTDSNTTRHLVRSPGGTVDLAVRWEMDGVRKVVFIESVSMDRDRSLDVSCLLGLPSRSRVKLDSMGIIVVP